MQKSRAHPQRSANVSDCRLKFLFNLFRIFNLFWIVFCASMIEMTLNENNMLETLAQHGDIAYPAQLIPLIVGALSFVRVLWLIYAEWKEADEKKSRRSNNDEPSKKTKRHPSLSNAYRFSFDIIKRIFSSSAQPEPETPTFEDEHPDMPDILRPWHHRYAVALLPWLSTFNAWKLAEGDNPSPDLEQSTFLGSKDGFKEDSKEVGID